MDHLYLAMFEGALLFTAGTPVREMYDYVGDAYADDPEIKALFGELKLDWDTIESGHPLKMVGPFIEREKSSSDFVLARAFTELAAGTSMVDTFWMAAGHAYALTKKLAVGPAGALDIKLARQIFGVFPASDPLFDFLFSARARPDWNGQIYGAGDETASFTEWARARAEPHAPAPAPPKCLDHLRAATDRLGDPEILRQALDHWTTYSGTLRVRQEFP